MGVLQRCLPIHYYDSVLEDLTIFCTAGLLPLLVALFIPLRKRRSLTGGVVKSKSHKQTRLNDAICFPAAAAFAMKAGGNFRWFDPVVCHWLS